MPFFADNQTVQRIPRCGKCGLDRGCRSPRMPVTGDGERRVLIVAEAPGRDEDREGTQLIGESGQLLRRILDDLGVSLDRDCWKTNAVCCWPGEGNPTPTVKQIQACRPNVRKAIEELRPEVIVLLGVAAVESVIGMDWTEAIGPVGRWVGWRIPNRGWNCWVCPTYHPAYLLRPHDGPPELWVRRHLEAAFGLEGRPWEEIPAYNKWVQKELDPGMIDDLINPWIDEYPDDPVAFDYETTSLKPDGPEAEIVSCSLGWKACDHLRACSFPWVGKAIPTMGRLLHSKVPKIAHNLKFEERWTRREFGRGVRNWLWCTMQNAHVLDNRRGITSLAFQSFVRLGQAPYDQAVKPFLKAKGPGKPNRIREVPLDDLLLYNGMDALCGYELAMIQMKEMGCVC